MSEKRTSDGEYAASVVGQAARLLGELSLDADCGSALTGNLVHVSVDPMLLPTGALRVLLTCRALGNPTVEWTDLRVMLRPAGTDDATTSFVFPRLDARGQATLPAVTPAEYGVRVYRATRAGRRRDRQARPQYPASPGAGEDSQAAPPRRVVARGDASRTAGDEPPRTPGQQGEVILVDGDLTLTLRPAGTGTLLRLAHPDATRASTSIEVLVVDIVDARIERTITLQFDAAGADGCSAEATIDRPLDGSFEIVHRFAEDAGN